MKRLSKKGLYLFKYSPYFCIIHYRFAIFPWQGLSSFSCRSPGLSFLISDRLPDFSVAAVRHNQRLPNYSGGSVPDSHRFPSSLCRPQNMEAIKLSITHYHIEQMLSRCSSMHADRCGTYRCKQCDNKENRSKAIVSCICV